MQKTITLSPASGPEDASNLSLRGLRINKNGTVIETFKIESRGDL